MGKRLLFLGMCAPLLLLPLGASPTAAGLSFTKIIIDPNPGNIPVEKLMADLNGDGKLDIIIGLEQAGLYWWGFPSSGKITDPWPKHTIMSTGNFYEDLQPYDLNGDGHVDIIACHDNNMYWYQNPGGDATGAWVEHFIGNGLGHDVRLADIDGDGKIDVVTQYGIYFQNNPDSWSFKGLGSLKGLALLDIGSGKGAINLVLNTASGVTWYENPRESGGDARTGNWTARIIDSSTGAEEQPLAGGFISNDGRMHLIGNPPNQGLVWWQAPADRRNGQWVKHVINSTYQDIHKIVVVDMDKNGSPDLVVAEQEQSHDPVGGPYNFNNDRVSIFFNNGAGSFTEQVLETTGGQNNVVGDVDGDGDLDILNVNHGFYGAPHPIELFVNNTNSGGAPPPPPPPPPGQAPWGGTAATIPGTFQAENYDTGGEGVAYHDLDAVNQGGQYRPNEGVDIGTSTHPGGNGFAVGWCQAGEWIDYTVNVTAAGTYTLTVPVALPFPGGTFHIEFGGVDKTGAFSVPDTGGADTWQTLTKTVSLSAGQQVMRVVMDSNGSAGWVTNLDYFTFTPAGGAPPPPPGGQGSLSGSTGGAAAGYNLTNLGTTDWVHWGRGGTYGNVDRKSSGGNQIGAVSVVGSGANSGGWSDPGRSVSWSDGTPTGSLSNDHGYIWSNGALGSGFSVTAPADPSSRTLNVYFGASTATCTLSAHLSDGSAADYSTTQTGPGAWFATLTYAAASAGQTLTVQLLKTGNNPGFTDGSADLDAVTLQVNAGSPPPAPPPAAPPPSPSGNLMRNPSFESDPSTDYFSYGSGTFSWATDAAHSGTHSLKIVSVQPSGTLTRWLSDTTSIGASAGSSYTATAWFKTLNATDHGVLTINFWNSASQVLAGMDGGTINGSTDWTSLSVSGTAPAGTAFIRVEFRLWGSGTLWADDASLIQN